MKQYISNYRGYVTAAAMARFWRRRNRRHARQFPPACCRAEAAADAVCRRRTIRLTPLAARRERGGHCRLVLAPRATLPHDTRRARRARASSWLPPFPSNWALPSTALGLDAFHPASRTPTLALSPRERPSRTTCHAVCKARAIVPVGKDTLPKPSPEATTVAVAVARLEAGAVVLSGPRGCVTAPANGPRSLVRPFPVMMAPPSLASLPPKSPPLPTPPPPPQPPPPPPPLPSSPPPQSCAILPPRSAGVTWCPAEAQPYLERLHDLKDLHNTHDLQPRFDYLLSPRWSSRQHFTA